MYQGADILLFNGARGEWALPQRTPIFSLLLLLHRQQKFDATSYTPLYFISYISRRHDDIADIDTLFAFI